MGRVIQSVLDQTYQDFELIIVNDGSTDNTENIIKEYQKKDKRIKYIRHEKNRSGSVTRNSAIKISRGEYIAFLNSDYEWFIEKLKRQMKFFKNASPEVALFIKALFIKMNLVGIHVNNISLRRDVTYTKI